MFLFHFQYHNFEDTVTNFDKDMFRKRIFLWYQLLQLNEYHIKKCRYLFLTIKTWFLLPVVLF